MAQWDFWWLHSNIWKRYESIVMSALLAMHPADQPSERPIHFMKRFNKEKQAELIRTIGNIKKNALDGKRA